jgi:hypothetical protein
MLWVRPGRCGNYIHLGGRLILSPPSGFLGYPRRRLSAPHRFRSDPGLFLSSPHQYPVPCGSLLGSAPAVPGPGVVTARGWHIVEPYVDRLTGSVEARPALNRLMADARQRKFDVVVVWKLDRFARSLKHLVTAIAEFESLGVQFVSLRDNLDLTTPSGRLMFHVIGAMAEFERSLIQERVCAGLRNARAKGRVLGRPRLPDSLQQSRLLHD